jgi:hypothetical protein
MPKIGIFYAKLYHDGLRYKREECGAGGEWGEGAAGLSVDAGTHQHIVDPFNIAGF